MSVVLYTTDDKKTPFIIDEEMMDLISIYSWKTHSGGYIYRRGRVNGVSKIIYLHREILFLNGKNVEGKWGDHVNGIKTDNRIENLRPSTPGQNAANKKKYMETESVYKGVKYRNGKWNAHIKVNGKHISSEPLKTELEAAKRYDCYALQYFGEFASFNIARPSNEEMEAFNTAIKIHAEKREQTRLRNIERNRPKLIFKKTSKFRGVSFKDSHQKWVAQITVKHNKHHIGIFDNAYDAALAYDEEARKLLGSEAILNFPHSSTEEQDRIRGIMNNPKKLAGTSQYFGVSKCRDKWSAYITIGGEFKYIGIYSTEKEAAIAYNTKCKAVFGDAKKLNQIRD